MVKSKSKKQEKNPQDVLSLGPKVRSSDFAVRLIAFAIGFALVALYIGIAVAAYPIVNSRLGGWFTFVCWLFVMALLTNLFVPGWSFVGKLWMSGNAKLRYQEEVKTADQRDRLQLMTARSRQKYGEEGPPESRNGDLSPDRQRNRDVGAGRSRS